MKIKKFGPENLQFCKQQLYHFLRAAELSESESGSIKVLRIELFSGLSLNAESIVLIYSRSV